MPLEEVQLSVDGRAWSILHTGAVISRDDELAFLRSEGAAPRPYGVVLWPAAIALAHEIATFVSAKIDRDAPLVAREAPPPNAGIAVHPAPGADRIARRRFHLDHVGAEVREHRSRERPGEQLTELEHTYAVERTRGRHGGVLPRTRERDRWAAHRAA